MVTCLLNRCMWWYGEIKRTVEETWPTILSWSPPVEKWKNVAWKMNERLRLNRSCKVEISKTETVKTEQWICREYIYMCIYTYIYIYIYIYPGMDSVKNVKVLTLLNFRFRVHENELIWYKKFFFFLLFYGHWNVEVTESCVTTSKSVKFTLPIPIKLKYHNIKVTFQSVVPLHSDVNKNH